MPRKAKRRSHGQGTIFERGGSWWIRWREGARRRAARFPSRELASRALAKIVSDVAAGRAGLPIDPRSTPTLEALAADWLERRKHTVRSFKDDRGRWEHHVGPFFGRYRPAEVTPALIRAFVEQKLRENRGEGAKAKPPLSSSTIGHCVRLLSSFFTDLVERGYAPTNPVRAVPRATRKLYREAHDPRTTPYLERREDIRSVFLALPSPTNVAFAIGVMAGLRTGEVLGLVWEHVDLDARRIHVRQQLHEGRLGPLKDDEARAVPIADALLPIVREWKVQTGGAGPLFRPRYPHRGGRPELGTAPQFTREHTLHAHLRKALKACKLEGRGLNWYRCTRHTFASQFAIGGGSLEKLRAILGHSSTQMTARYMHLRPDMFGPADLAAVAVDLSPATGKVLPLPRADAGTIGHAVVTGSDEATASTA